MKIKSIRHDGVTCILCDAATRKPLEQNSEVTSFRGEKMRVTGGTAPHKPGSQGYIHVLHIDEDVFDAISHVLYVVAFNAVWLGESEHN
jgi:hypothetical protein